MRFFLTALAALLLSAAPAAADEAAYDTLLARYVSAGADGVNRVDYARWNNSPNDRAALDAYVAELAGQRPSTFERDRAYLGQSL